MQIKRMLLVGVVVVVLPMLVMACGGDDEGEDDNNGGGGLFSLAPELSEDAVLIGENPTDGQTYRLTAKYPSGWATENERTTILLGNSPETINDYKDETPLMMMIWR